MDVLDANEEIGRVTKDNRSHIVILIGQYKDDKRKTTEVTKSLEFVPRNHTANIHCVIWSQCMYVDRNAGRGGQGVSLTEQISLRAIDYGTEEHVALKLTVVPAYERISESNSCLLPSRLSLFACGCAVW